jgi:cytochrome c peroxidase
MGIDSFQADRSPTRMYRTAPLAGLWTHQKGGFYHDGRFATLRDVIEHYDRNFRLGLAVNSRANGATDLRRNRASAKWRFCGLEQLAF